MIIKSLLSGLKVVSAAAMFTTAVAPPNTTAPEFSSTNHPITDQSGVDRDVGLKCVGRLGGLAEGSGN